MSQDYNPNGRKNTIVSVSHNPPGSLPESNLSRILPRQLSTGSTRGTQTVGYGNTKIDGSNNSITVGDSIFLDGNNGIITVQDNESGTQGLGDVPGTSPTEAGFFQTDSTGTVIYKLVNGTQYTYDASDDYNNIILNGFAPDDGRAGIWVAKPGFDATELLNAS